MVEALGIMLFGLVRRAFGWGRALVTGNAAPWTETAAVVAVVVAVEVGLLALWPRHDDGRAAAAELARGAERARAELLTKALKDRDAAAEREAQARADAEDYRGQVADLAHQITAQIESQPAAADVQALPDDVVALIADRQRKSNARLGAK